jgi:steroid delta-isomerase-like uncharacterized protein
VVGCFVFTHKKGERQMSIEENKDIVTRWNQGYHARNPEVFEEFLAEDYHIGKMDREAHKQRSIAGWQSGAFSDHGFEVHDTIAEGDKVVVRWTMWGTHTGTFLGVPPTHKVITTSGINIYQIKDGKIVEEWGSVDMLSVMQQLGLVPSMG